VIIASNISARNFKKIGNVSPREQQDAASNLSEASATPWVTDLTVAQAAWVVANGPSPRPVEEAMLAAAATVVPKEMGAPHSPPHIILPKIAADIKTFAALLAAAIAVEGVLRTRHHSPALN
jgi:hypothetical protein